jgi:hypothetical protein
MSALFVRTPEGATSATHAPSRSGLIAPKIGVLMGAQTKTAIGH